MTTIEATPQQKILSKEEATQKLLRLRGTIPPNEAARKAVREEKERWAEEIARFAAEEKARQKRERIPPTPQRLSKGDITNKSDRAGIVAPEVQFQAKDPLENVYKHLTDRETAALARLITNMEYALKTRSITANYEGSSGGGYGPRHGGLPDDAREAATVADWMLDKMHPEFQKLAKAVAYGVRREITGNPLSQREIMTLFFPEMGDKGRKDGGWIALCRALAWRTIEREWELDDAITGKTSRGDNHVKQIAKERGSR